MPSGSFIELSQADLERVAAAAHARVADVSRQLARLERAGFLPIVPTGGPLAAASFERVGVVSATRLAPGCTGRCRRASGCSATPATGTSSTAPAPPGPSPTRSSGQATRRSRDGRWQRVGVFRAWQVAEAVVLRTKEGSATARPGDWVVEGPGGERWPVSDGQFRRSYRLRQDRAATVGQASAPAAISSSTAPTISQ